MGVGRDMGMLLPWWLVAWCIYLQKHRYAKYMYMNANAENVKLHKHVLKKKGGNKAMPGVGSW